MFICELASVMKWVTEFNGGKGGLASTAVRIPSPPPLYVGRQRRENFSERDHMAMRVRFCSVAKARYLTESS